MQITLKNVKTLKALSHETDCFHATVYIDGQKAGEVSNEGQGGPNSYHPNSLWQRLNEYAKTLPTQHAYGMDLQPDADWIIGDAFDAVMREKDLARLLKNKVLFTKADGRIYETRKMTTQEVAKIVERKLVKDAVTILNALPFAEALSIYAASASR